MGDTREDCLQLIGKYRDRHLADRVFDLAWTHSQVLLRQLNASLADAQLYEHMATSIIYPNANLRAEPGVLLSNRRGQSGRAGQRIPATWYPSCTQAIAILRGSRSCAMRTMGFQRLELVLPGRFPDPESSALAAGADDVLGAAGIHGGMVESLAGASLVLGLSARRRGVNLPEITPRVAAEQALAAAGRGAQVALVFGNERTGLENDELARCHAMVRIPSVDDFSSLNLSQAVQVMAYELRVAMLGELPAVVSPQDEPLADDDAIKTLR
ncbi:MAG: hypothetical protein WDW36_010030 [Sanguina aurantia]